MMKKDKITDKDYKRLLVARVGDMSAGTIVSIPGVYEILAKHFNDAILEDWEVEKEADNSVENQVNAGRPDGHMDQGCHEK